MDNARSPSQIPVERQISVEDDTSDGCNNIAAAQPHRNSSCQTAEPLCRNTVEQAKCYTINRIWHVPHGTYLAPSLSRRTLFV